MLPNFSFVIPGKLAGCAHPGGGEQLRRNLAELTRLQKITALLTLSERALPKEIVEEFRMESFHFPVRDFGIPRLEETDEAIDFVHRRIANGGRVVIHCAAGCGRTGMLLACCLVSEENNSPEKAVETVRILRPGSVETSEQENFVARWAVRQRNRKNQDAKRDGPEE